MHDQWTGSDWQWTSGMSRLKKYTIMMFPVHATFRKNAIMQNNWPTAAWQSYGQMAWGLLLFCWCCEEQLEIKIENKFFKEQKNVFFVHCDWELGINGK